MKPTRYLKLCGDNRAISQERVADSDLPEIVASLAESKCFDALDLRYNRITDEGCRHLVTLFEVILHFILKSCTAVVSLEFACFKICWRSLKVAPHIAEVNIMCNDIGEKGAQLLARALHVYTIFLVELALFA